MGARQGPVRDRQAGLQDRLPAGGARAERGRLDVDDGALRAAAHRRRRRARRRSIRAAAQRWSVDVSQCRTENGFVINARGEKLSYGELAAEAAKLPLSAAPPLKDRSRFRLIGKPVARLDTPAKCNGSAIYGIDVVVPGMLNAAIKTAPSFTGQVIAIKNEAEILKMPGVRAVVKLPAVTIADEDAAFAHAPDAPRDNAVCVIADYYWQAKRAIDSLDVAFDRGSQGDLSTAKIDAMLDAALNAEKGVTALVRGRPREILQERAASVIERRFVLPHIAHAPHEPVNATASYRDGAVEVWGPIQSVTACQEAVAHAAGCAADDVKVHVTFLGGSFGRKIVPDYVVQAVHASKAVGRPVKLIRSREEDTQHDVYRPNAGGRLRAVVDDAGYPLAVHARVAGQSLFGATRKSWLEQTPDGAWDESMVDGIYNQSYRLPNFLVETVDTPLPVPVYFMRSVGSTAAVFFWESLISELAHRANIDQYAYRRNLLSDDPLALRVLDAVAQASGWGRRRRRPTRSAASPTIATSAAAAGSKPTSRRSWSSIASPTGFAVKRVFCAVDPGLAVNPNTLRAQIEGGIGFAMTNALKSRITFSNGGTDQSNFFDYPLISIDEMPEIVPSSCRAIVRRRASARWCWRRSPPPSRRRAARHRPAARRDAVPRRCVQDGGREHERAGKIASRDASTERLPNMSVKFSVNGKPAEFDGPDDVPLLWVVREQLGLTGSKFGCGVGLCGACTMHIDGAADPHLRHADRRCAGPPRHDHRGPVAELRSSRAEGLDRARRSAMRLLPVRHDHGRGLPAQPASASDRPGHRPRR